MNQEQREIKEAINDYYGILKIKRKCDFTDGILCVGILYFVREKRKKRKKERERERDDCVPL